MQCDAKLKKKPTKNQRTNKKQSIIFISRFFSSREDEIMLRSFECFPEPSFLTKRKDQQERVRTSSF